MPFTHSQSGVSKPAPIRPKKGPVFCVGWQAFVNSPQPEGTEPSPPPMTDVEGRPVASDLADGEAVEIVSWRPRAREGADYLIRRSTDGSEGWLAAAYLRRLREAPQLVEAVGVTHD